jgi:hypothetical protein
MSIDDRVMQNVVTRLITYYDAGERDRDRLVSLAACELHRAAS